MITLPCSLKNSKFTQLGITCLICLTLFNTAKAESKTIDVTNMIKDNQPLDKSSIILEKTHLNKVNSSQKVTINGTTNATFILQGPNPAYINVSPTHITTELINKSNASSGDPSINQEANNDLIRVIAQHVVFSAKKDDDDGETEKTIEYKQRNGYSTIFVRVFPKKQEIEIEFVDERLSLRVNETSSESQEDPEDNIAIMAAYFDALIMSPLSEVANTGDLVDQIDADTLNEDIQNVRDVLLALPTDVLADVLNSTHPGKFADLDPIIFNNHSLLYNNICQHFNEVSCCINKECKLNIWGKAYTNFQHRGTERSITGYHSRTGGMFVALDCAPVNAFCCGSGFAYTCDNIKWKDEEADALTHSYYGFLYSSLQCRTCFLQAMASLSYSSIDANRFIELSPDLRRKAHHDNHAWTYGGRLNGGFNFYLPCAIRLQVYDSIDLGEVHTNAFTEGGASALNLHVNSRSSTHLRNELGVQFSQSFISSCNNICWVPSIALAWVYQNPLSGNHMTGNMQNQSPQFRIQTRNKTTNQISPQASLTITSMSGIYLSAYYYGAFGDDWNSNECSIHMGKTF